jgi:hypothetical protein
VAAAAAQLALFENCCILEKRNQQYKKRNSFILKTNYLTISYS